MIDYKLLAKDVELVVCSHVGVSHDEMSSHNKKGACVKAKHLSIFILHTSYGVSVKWLSKHYGFGVRHIFRVVAQIRDYMKYGRTYSDLYDIVKKDLKLD